MNLPLTDAEASQASSWKKEALEEGSLPDPHVTMFFDFKKQMTEK